MKLIFLNIIVGAIIGLFTNWIAIVMLFRPHTEKRMFGKRLPLTPGLIPRRQDELAERLGQVVEEDLLTPEGLAKSLKRPELAYAVKKAAIQSLADTLQAAPTAGALLTRLFSQQALAQIEQSLTGQAVSFLRSEAGRARLEQMADSLFDHLRGSLSSEEVRRDLARGFAAPLHASLATGALTWKTALPEGARLLIEERLQAQVDPLVDGASDWLMEPAVVHAISKMLTEKVESIPLIGGMARAFLTPDRVASEIVPRLQNVVTSHTTRDLIRDKMQETVVGFWERPIGETVSRMSADDLSDLLEKVLHVLLERMFTEPEWQQVGEQMQGADGQTNLLERDEWNGQDNSADLLVTTRPTSPRDTFRTLIVNGLLAGANEHTIRDLVHRLFDTVLCYDVRAVYIAHTEAADRLIESTWHYVRGKMIDELPSMLEALAIRQVVREQVASYPIVTLEKLIVSVVNKELKMITYLGGVLGAIIGLVQGLISQL